MNKTFVSMIVLGVVAFNSATFATGHERAQAEPWTPATLFSTLQGMPKGDIQRGKELHNDMFCASCHGVAGEAQTHNWPALNGQRAEYTYKMLLDYQDGRRHEDKRADIMVEVAQFLTKQQMADLAMFYAAQDLPKPREHGLSDEEFKRADRIARKGDPSRLLTPCASCHGVSGEGGINETPALAGQQPDYFIRTMRAYRDGQRDNDVNKGMSQFAKHLSDEDIRVLAYYYASIDGETKK